MPKKVFICIDNKSIIKYYNYTRIATMIIRCVVRIDFTNNVQINSMYNVYIYV